MRPSRAALASALALTLLVPPSHAGGGPLGKVAESAGMATRQLTGLALDGFIGQGLAQIRTSDWMSRLDPGLALSGIVIPGTHDAGANDFTDRSAVSDYGDQPDELKYLNFLQTGIGGALASVPRDRLARWARTQRLDFPGQLAAGVRFFDLRTELKKSGPTPPANGSMYLVHGMYGPDLFTTLDQVAAFLAAHAREVVILDFGAFQNLDEAAHGRLVAKLKSALGSRMIPEADPDRITLGALWAKKQQVVVLYDAGAARDPDAGFWTHRRRRSKWPNRQDATSLFAYLDAEVLQHGAGVLHVLQGVITPTNDFIVAAEQKIDGLGRVVAELEASVEAARDAVTAARKARDGARSAFDKTLGKIGLSWKKLGKAAKATADTLGLGSQYRKLVGSIEDADHTLDRAEDHLADVKRQLAARRAELAAAPSSLLEVADDLDPRVVRWVQRNWEHTGKVNIVEIDAASRSHCLPLLVTNFPELFRAILRWEDLQGRRWAY